MHGVDYIFHAAALKQVPSCEFFPMEAVRTNVIGTDNVLTAAMGNFYRVPADNRGLNYDKYFKEGDEKACFILSGIDEKGLLQSVDTAVEMNRAGDYGIPVPDYIEENVSSKVVKIIQSYTGVVNKMVWRKESE